jgi:serine protease DegQ
MARVTLYSSSRQSAATAAPSGLGGFKPLDKADEGVSASMPVSAPPPVSRFRRFYRRYERPALLSAGALFALLAVFLYAKSEPAPRKLTQRDIDMAVLHTLETKPIPSRPAAAYQTIAPSIVRVRQLKVAEEPAKDGAAKPAKPGDPKHKTDMARNEKPKNGNPDSGKKAPSDRASNDKTPDKKAPSTDTDPKTDKSGETEEAVGTGVVIEDTGKILTALHVVAGAKHIGVIFADGTESDADVVGSQPENDIAVLQAKTLPDDLMPATLRPSLRGLRPGDEVMAVGYPFGVGPSLSAGVISGFGRSYASKGEHPMTNLIQFDAAANPGNSGGPLINDDGEVIGIVTAILNPTEQAFFVGIGFAVPIENAASGVGISPY